MNIIAPPTTVVPQRAKDASSALQWNSNDSFTRYGVSQSEKTAPVGVKEIYELETKAYWRPGDGQMPYGQVPDPSGQWLFTISFYNVGRARQINIAQIYENREITFALQPVENVPDIAANKVESNSTDSESSWSLISRWLEDCLTTHGKCAWLDNDSAAGFYLIRLIDIGDNQSSVILLRETTETSLTGHYNALFVSGDLHVAMLMYQQSFNRWMLKINKRAKREVPFRRSETSLTDTVRIFLPESEDEWNPAKWVPERGAPTAAYLYTTSPQDAMMVFCLPVMRRKRTKALQREEIRTDIDKISGLIVVPAPVGMQGIYWRIGRFDKMPERSELGFGEECCYRKENKRLVSEGPGGFTEMVLLN